MTLRLVRLAACVAAFSGIASSYATVEFAGYTWANAGGTMALDSGNLVTTVQAASSSSWTTYLAPANDAITLASAGDSISVTWTFSLTGVNATNASQSFRLALTDTPEASRLAGDGAPGTAAYAGYAMFMNMGQTTGHGNSFSLVERAAPETGSAFLSSSGSWSASLANGAGSGVTGYADATSYTFNFTATRNATDGLDIVASMTGGSLGGTGSFSVSYTDATPNTFSFDTFGIRPSRADQSATTFTTTAFSVSTAAVPEPSTYAALLGAGVLGFAAWRRRRHR